MRPDAKVTADTVLYVLDICAQTISKVRKIVHKADSCCQHRVACVFRELRATHVHMNHLGPLHGKGFIQAIH